MGGKGASAHTQPRFLRNSVVGSYQRTTIITSTHHHEALRLTARPNAVDSAVSPTVSTHSSSVIRRGTAVVTSRIVQSGEGYDENEEKSRKRERGTVRGKKRRHSNGSREKKEGSSGRKIEGQRQKERERERERKRERKREKKREPWCTLVV